MSELTLFGGGNPLANSAMFKALQGEDDNLVGSGGGSNRISLRGGRFREVVSGEQVNVKSDGVLEVIIVNAAKLSRTYYPGAYDAEKIIPPACWSPDTQAPDKAVPADTRQSSSCMTCPQNIKGSGQNESRACRFNQRLAVMLPGKPDMVYQLQLPATSIFGETKDGNMGMQAYAKYLKAHKTPSIAVVTQMSFDENSDTSKLFFKAVRALTEEELQAAVDMKNSDEALKAITFTAFQTKKDSSDREGPVADDEIDLNAIPEPTKVAKKKVAVTPPVETNLASVVDQWDA